jgi:predicted HD phosphohydrolase
MSSTEISQRLQPLIHLLQESIHNDYIGEPVSQYEHAIQAAHFARIYMKKQQANRNSIPAPLSPTSKVAKITDSSLSWNDEQLEVILAALLHDVGHSIAMNPPAGFQPYPHDSDSSDSLNPKRRFMDKFGAFSHESIGARYLSTLGFSDNLCAMVASHVAVKRYLCAVDPSYNERLSSASRSTLKYQGGPMSREEVSQFEADPLKHKKLIVRYCDELAKQQGLQVDNLSYYIPMLVAHIHNQETSKNGKSDVEEESKENMNEKLMV